MRVYVYLSLTTFMFIYYYLSIITPVNKPSSDTETINHGLEKFTKFLKGINKSKKIEQPVIFAHINYTFS